MQSSTRAVSFRKHRALTAAALAMGILLPWSAFAQSAASEAAHERKALNANEDCEDIVLLPEGTVAECPSPAASQTAAIAHAKHDDVVCPPPAREDGPRGCVLDYDVVLDEPLKLESFTRLDCDGHQILPLKKGTPENSRTAAKEYKPSTPEIAIVVAKGQGVTVENCRIGSHDMPFDFGVVVVGAKMSSEPAGDDSARHEPNRIKDNSIAVRYAGVLVAKSDKTHVEDNHVLVSVGAKGIGIDIFADSDGNHVEGNTVLADASVDANTFVPTFPGTKVVGGQRTRGIRLALGGNRVLNFCIDGDIIQIPGLRDALNEGSPARQEHNIVKGNYIDVGLVTLPFGIANATGSVRPVLEGNTIVGAHQGFHFSGIQPGEDFGVAGHCTLDPQRACGTTDDCFLAACGDTVSKGECEGADTLKDVAIGATDPQVIGNTIDGTNGKVDIGMYLGVPGPQATIVNNIVRHASLAGIRLNNRSLEASTLIGNRLEENRFGLVLAMLPDLPADLAGQKFGSSIFLNDVVGSTQQAIATGVCQNMLVISCESTTDCPGKTGPCLTHTMPFIAELSVDGQGNYWDRACSDSDGFRSADEPDALGRRDTSALNVNDSHPYGVSVAGGVDETTLTCH